MFLTEFTSPYKKFTRIIPFVSQKAVSMTSTDCALSDFFFLQDGLWCPLVKTAVAFTDGWGGGKFVVWRHSPYIRIVYVADVVTH